MGRLTRDAGRDPRMDAIDLGLAQPNVGVKRLLGYPRVMASPPTITAGVSGGASVIADAVPVVIYNEGERFFSKMGGIAGQGLNFPDSLYWSTISPYVQGLTWGIGAFWAVEFEWYGSEFELILKGSASGSVRLVVGEEYNVWAGRSDVGASDGNQWLIHYDFGSAAFRQIRFEFNGSVSFGGLMIGPNDSVWPSSAPRGPKVIVTGDSFCEDFHHWPASMALNLGWRDLAIVGKGSTGYLDENSGDDTFRHRAQLDIYDHSPDIVIVSGGLNDSGGDAVATGVEAATFYQEIRANLPDAMLIVSGFNQTRGTPFLANWVLVRDAIRAAAETYADAYIELMGGPYPYPGVDLSPYVNSGWMSGMGFVGAVTGDGNSDLFVGADGTHPTASGHFYRGFRHAQALAAQMPILRG